MKVAPRRSCPLLLGLCLLALMLPVRAATGASPYSGFAVEVLSGNGASLRLVFGERRRAIESRLGAPLDSYANTMFRPEGVRKIAEYRDFKLEYDEDRLISIVFGKSFKGKARMIAPDKYDLADWLRIGDSFSRIEKLLRAFENRLKKDHQMRLYSAQDEVEIGEVRKTVYAIYVDREYHRTAWIYLDKTHLSYVVTYRFGFDKLAVEEILLEVDVYISEYGFVH